MKKTQKAKKILALAIVATMLALSILGAGCSKRAEDDKGAILLMYLAADPSNINLDPGKLLYSAEAIKFLGNMFESLTVVDEKGKLQKGMAQNWTITEDEVKGEYTIVFNLKSTKWSDGTAVSADDFVYAWKRILEPEFSSPAAALLFDIKNARAVKEGEMTVDDLGVYADDATELRVVFDKKIDYNRFLMNLASIYLVPLRGDTVDFVNEQGKSWTETPGQFLSNGPFAIKGMEYGKAYRFERSIYYLLPGKKDEDVFKYVTPFSLQLDYTRNLDALATAYANDDYLYYLGSVPKARYDEFKDKAVLKDLLSTYSYHFNVDKAPFNNPDVRKALSIALDRNEIAKLAGLGTQPATGIVPHGIIDVKATEEYRKVRGDAISPSANFAEAEKLLQGVTKTSFILKIRDNESEIAVAEYVKSVWEKLGFSVIISPVKGIAVEESILNRDYDVMGYDDQAPGLDAWSVLATFAKPFCGETVIFGDEGTSTANPHITGFYDAAYDALIEDIFANYAEDTAGRTAKLFEAEKALVNISPVVPLYFNTSINLTNKLTGLTYSKFGYTLFTKANLKNYLEYITTVEDTREVVTPK